MKAGDDRVMSGAIAGAPGGGVRRRLSSAFGQIDGHTRATAVICGIGIAGNPGTPAEQRRHHIGAYLARLTEPLRVFELSDCP